jgi:putative ABC transport system substrate-binding protein
VPSDAKPADLPVEQPTELGLMVNRRTAQALGSVMVWCEAGGGLKLNSRQSRGRRCSAEDLLAGSAVVLAGPVFPSDGLAEQPKKPPLIGLLAAGSPNPVTDELVTAIREGLGEAGFLEGRDVAIEYRWAESWYDRLPALAADLARRNVDVIVGDEQAAGVAKAATSTIPIVSTFGSDPVESGLVASFARPGGNLTGFSVFAAELTAKKFELLSELLPRAGVVALLVNPNYRQTERIIRDARAAAGARGV